MENVSLENVKTIWQNPGWYRALTLTERVASLQAATPARDTYSPRIREKAEQKLQQWKNRAPYTKGMSFEKRLAVDNLTEEDLFMLLAESNEAIQSRLSPPDWLETLHQAFEEASASPDGVLSTFAEESESATHAFLNVIRPLLHRGMQQLMADIHELAQQYACLPFDPQTIVAELFRNLLPQLRSKLSRPLVLEMRVSRALGHLNGDTPEERFKSFIQQIGTDEKRQAFLEEYAVLARQCVITIEQWRIFSLEILSHLCADWQQICATFTPVATPGLLSEVHTGSGDTHRGGRSVVTLTFQSGFKLIYKPRSLALDRHFQDLLHWLNERGSHPSFLTISVLDRATYGWSAFVKAQECQSEDEVRRFYQRQGAYLAFLYVLDAADLHAENIIAVGEYPVLIDLEALFHPHMEMDNLFSAKEPASAALHQSVMRVGLLPHRAWGNDETRGVNMSGLGGEEGQMSPRALPRWENAGTDEMCLVHARVEIASSKNRPTLNGRSVDALNYRDCILAGFDGMYQTLLDHRDALLREMLPRFACDEIRFVARPTDIYGRLLYESFRPDLLQDALERDRHFDRLWVGIEWQPYMASIIRAECADLLQGDIPLFTTRPSSLDLFTSLGEGIPAFFRQSSMDIVRKRVQNLHQQDRVRQRWIIDATFTCLTLDTRRAFALPSPMQIQTTAGTCSHWLTVARAIGDKLCQSAIQEKDLVNWLGILQVREQEWEVEAAGLDLYNGLPGITLFLAHLARLSGEARYLNLARTALRTIQHMLHHPQKPPILNYSGAFEGCSGLIYLFTQLGVLWNEPALLQQAEQLVKLLPEAIARDETFDIMAGSAGSIMALLSLYAVAPAAHILETAIFAGDHLLARASSQSSGIGWKQRRQEAPLTGMAHGNAGIALSLLRLAEVSGAERFQKAALAALAYERSLFSAKAQNWPDLRNRKNTALKQSDGEDAERFMVAWCHGASGIALARLASPNFYAEKTLQEEVEYALAATLVACAKEHADPTLCHGSAGLLETLLTVRQALRQDDNVLSIHRLAQNLHASLEMSESPVPPWWTKAPGFMTGLAGIGYTFLRLADPESVPSVLTLEVCEPGA